MSLTLVSPNRNRLDFTKPSSQWFIKSIQWQDCRDFSLLLIDGGSDNYEDIKKYVEEYNGPVSMKIMQFKIGKDFHKTLLNNVAIRNCQSEYIATTDVDMIFGRCFISSVIPLLNPHVMVESRTMYWKNELVEKIYKNELDPHNNIDSCKIGRIKKRTTPGGFQCLHKDSWSKLHGYNEEQIIGWGSEDVELLERVKRAGIKVKWMGEGINDIMLFHQPHSKNIVEELKSQENNKKILNNISGFMANPNGWGGLYS